jgi:hypothetical protein
VTAPDWTEAAVADHGPVLDGQSLQHSAVRAKGRTADALPRPAMVRLRHVGQPLGEWRSLPPRAPARGGLVIQVPVDRDAWIVRVRQQHVHPIRAQIEAVVGEAAGEKNTDWCPQAELGQGSQQLGGVSSRILYPECSSMRREICRAD